MNKVKVFASVIASAITVFLVSCFIVGGFDIMSWHGSARMVMVAAVISLSIIYFEIIK